MDERGIHRDLRREKGRAARGAQIHDSRRGRKFGRANVAAALNENRLIAPRCYTGTTTAVVFEDWFETQLLTSLREGSTTIPDNARFHRKTEPAKPAKEAKARPLFLPPYSPDFNPIEKSWANLKRWLQDNASCFASIQNAIYAYLV